MTHDRDAELVESLIGNLDGEGCPISPEQMRLIVAVVVARLRERGLLVEPGARVIPPGYMALPQSDQEAHQMQIVAEAYLAARPR
jgi:hypothetical protein